jgi:hypothetical protein
MGSGPDPRTSTMPRCRQGRPRCVAAALPLVLAGCGYHVGNPPSLGGLALGAVEAPVAEPALPGALEGALADAIRRRGAGGERTLQARVLRAELAPGAARAGGIEAWTATLEVRFEVSGPAPAVLVLQRDALVPAAGEGADGLPAARATAFAGLARVLADEAVDWFLYAPRGEVSAP